MIENIINNFRSALRTVNSPLKDFVKYGHTYFLIRAIAIVLNEHKQSIDLKIDSSSLNTATGKDLDRIALNFGINRKEGKVATGFVLARSSAYVELNSNTILKDVEGKFNFLIVNSVSIFETEALVEVSSLTPKQIFVEAGTVLISDVYPEVKFVVGQYRSLKFEPVGSIIGGNLPESDREFKLRIHNLMKRTPVTSLYQLREDILELGIVDRVYIIPHSPRVGYFTVYINSNNEEVKLILTEYINSVIPIGSSFLVKHLEIFYVDFVIDLKTDPTYLNNDLKLNVTNEIDLVLSKLSPGESLSISRLISSILKLEGINDCTIVSPEYELEGRKNYIYQLNNLKLNIDL